jgi:uncharacterized protein (TIGR03083 family)
MDLDEVWRTIDTERLAVADFLDGLSPEQWETPSLCGGWRVREVAAHLTLAHLGALPATAAFVRARGSFNRMIHDTAVRRAELPVERYGVMLRAMVGSRKKAPGVTPLEPLIDVLVHSQDMAVPLGVERPMPLPAAIAAADRVWPDLFPFRAGKRFGGLCFTATDCEWTAGEGEAVSGPISGILLVLTGRPAGVERLTGPGVGELAERLAPPPPRPSSTSSQTMLV